MKGARFTLFVSLLCALGLASTIRTATAQPVLNEINLVVGPNVGQFVELHGAPLAPLDNHALVVVKSAFSGGVWTAQTQAAVDLTGTSLDGDGFALIEGSGWQNTVAAVVLAAQPASDFPLNQPPVFTNLADAVLYGNTSVTNPQMAAIVAAVDPDATATVYEGGAGVNAGTDGLSRVPDGGAPLDQNFVMQALSPGATNVLACEGGHLALNNPSVTTFCTDLGPAIVGFSHQSDAANAAVSLAVVDAATEEVVSVFLGTALNMEGLGDGTYEVVAISHDAPLATGWTSLADVATEPAGGCVSVSPEAVTVLGETCEIPSCDGGTLLTAGGEPDAQACLTEDGALVSFGYYSDAVEGAYVFMICSLEDTILATTDEPYFDFASFGEAGDYHVWGLSYQDGLDSATVAVGESALLASSLGCDSLSSAPLLVQILQCGAAGLCEDLIISEYV